MLQSSMSSDQNPYKPLNSQLYDADDDDDDGDDDDDDDSPSFRSFSWLQSKNLLKHQGRPPLGFSGSLEGNAEDARVLGGPGLACVLLEYQSLNLCAYIHVYIHIYVYVYIHTNVYTYICLYMYIHIYYLPELTQTI